VSEAMMSSILALTDPGDDVIIFEPWYENYVPDCLMAGTRPRFVPLREPDYRIDAEALHAAVGSRTRLLLLNTPHNPTGRVMSAEELAAIAEVCRAHNLIAVTDEIYEHITYDGAAHVSIGSLPGMAERTVTISGLGKTYAVTGWRVGWILAPEMLSGEIRKVHDYLTICAPAPFQAAGMAAMRLPDRYYAEMRREYAARRRILLDALTGAGFRFRIPEGAYYVMADFSHILWDLAAHAKPGWTADRAFAEYMARVVGVAVVPGSSFYMNDSQGTTRVRFNFAKAAPTLHEAARRLRRLGPAEG
ncbi:MAG: pyridoxal phosphate-dependent aminotransferase, partial [bacterium]